MPDWPLLNQLTSFTDGTGVESMTEETRALMLAGIAFAFGASSERRENAAIERRLRRP